MPSQEREFLKMSINAHTSSQPIRTTYKRLSTPNGTLFEILASPEEVEDGICLIRGTVPPGVAVPLHSHSDLEIFYVLEGAMEIFPVEGRRERMDDSRRGGGRRCTRQHQARIAQHLVASSYFGFGDHIEDVRILR